MLGEPYSRVLLYPWDEVLVLIAEGQEIEAEDGEAATIRLLSGILQRL